MIEDTSQTLRRRLWAEHAGVPLTEMGDFQHDLRVFSTVARRNTELLRELFGDAIPEGGASTVAQYQRALRAGKPVRSPDTESLVRQLQGHVVEFPHQFLESMMVDNTTQWLIDALGGRQIFE